MDKFKKKEIEGERDERRKRERGKRGNRKCSSSFHDIKILFRTHFG